MALSAPPDSDRRRRIIVDVDGKAKITLDLGVESVYLPPPLLAPPATTPMSPPVKPPEPSPNPRAARVRPKRRLRSARLRHRARGGATPPEAGVKPPPPARSAPGPAATETAAETPAAVEWTVSNTRDIPEPPKSETEPKAVPPATAPPETVATQPASAVAAPAEENVAAPAATTADSGPAAALIAEPVSLPETCNTVPAAETGAKQETEVPSGHTAESRLEPTAERAEPGVQPEALRQGAEALRRGMAEAAAGAEESRSAGTLVEAPGDGSSASAGDGAGRQKILIIDDDPVMRMLLAMGLRFQGYECLTAENGKVAQELIAGSRVDGILVDLMMPVMDGLAFIQWLRETLRDATPVVAFTSFSDPRIRDQALKLGASRVALKPLQLPEVVSILRGLLRQPSHS